jgi:hypothetical protein
MKPKWITLMLALAAAWPLVSVQDLIITLL